MHQAEQIRVLKTLIERLDAGTNVDAGGLQRLPTSSYTDPDIVERELNEFFLATPQCIGISGGLAEPRAFLTNNDLGVPILATRDLDGRFKAFINSCRHRGVIVESEERGKKRRFTCPFHSWSYDTGGALVGLPKEDHFGNVDKSCLGLKPLPAEERHGLLFVHPDPNGVMDLDALIGPELNDEFSSWNFDGLVPFMNDEYETAFNWKLAMDTFGETYHFASLHKNTLISSFHGNVQCYDEYGHNHRMLLCRPDIDTMRQLPEEEWSVEGSTLSVYWHFPNVIIVSNRPAAIS
jgi:phenylpropionate dioxygenase-like ring-hydroxylating dioxygenase large terminal subunit